MAHDGALIPFVLVSMLSRLTKTNRMRATIALVAAYAFCVLAPHATLAFTNGTAAMHCLTELSDLAHVHGQPTVAVEHTHADGVKHTHGAPPPVQTAQYSHSDGTTHDHGKTGKADDGNCCGLFCITALNHDGVAALPAPPPRAFENALPEAERASRDPDRLYEPPIG